MKSVFRSTWLRQLSGSYALRANQKNLQGIATWRKVTRSDVPIPLLDQERLAGKRNDENGGLIRLTNFDTDNIWGC